MKKELELDIKVAKNIIDCGQIVYPRFTDRSPIYRFTTENLTDYYSQIDFEGKNVLCVSSSGDHAINAYLYGAKSVDTFDVNRLQKYMQDLKIAAIKELDLESFLMFFNTDDIEPSFERKAYEQFRDLLPEETRIFWDELYKTYKGYEIEADFLLENRLDDRALQKRNPYTKAMKYLEARKKIEEKSVTFFQSNLLELPNCKNLKVYDIILLSNINQYVHDKVAFQETLEALLEEHLTPGGILTPEYFYPSLKPKKERIKETYYRFPAVERCRFLPLARKLPGEKPERQDSVVILQKKR